MLYFNRYFFSNVENVEIESYHTKLTKVIYKSNENVYFCD